MREHERILAKEEAAEFWKWVASRRDGDNPRGDFIRDTRFLLEIDVDPETRFDRIFGNPAAYLEYRKFRRQWRKENPDV